MSDIISIRAHFDGKTIVPDEPVQLPKGAAMVIDIRNVSDPLPGMLKAKTAEERAEAFRRVVRMMEGLPDIPLESLRRENLYADDY